MITKEQAKSSQEFQMSLLKALGELGCTIVHLELLPTDRTISQDEQNTTLKLTIVRGRDLKGDKEES